MPDNVVFVNRLAWVLATCPETSIRNGIEAVRLAQQATQMSQGSEPAFLGTLAAAFGETGDFGQAVDAAERAVAIASARGDRAMTDALRIQINRYGAGSPYHEILMDHSAPRNRQPGGPWYVEGLGRMPRSTAAISVARVCTPPWPAALIR